ncbi:hypothetical protein ISF_05433 [Cordyceps fumosorosea ARSEF 2679]|uniref:Uncharacterized protein n=1 Tax=Cordyceps fumosorosea (strain ARSEF 2679) TaxID=1081104 RepID=A0A167U9E6_CORFA|nr:hypothetical protein ISF_05433 [Cordyceps fumosorosea ARSEF 2679]OAA61354.1 hypothetical protein ISF_05433 [Cordyceps fumosorosea ARSEF 2679]
MATVRHSTVAAILLGFLALCVASTVPTGSTVTSTIQPTTTSTIATPAPAVSSAFSAVSGSTRKVTSSGPITTAPVFLPYYDNAAWSALRGSILSSDDVKNCTTYTIFCRKEPKQACNLALEFPFIIIEGPKTVEFHGTYTSTFIADIGCNLDGRTAATCSGYSSYKSGYKNGIVTGPTELSWTSTLTGTDVKWGVLTLTDIPKPSGDDDNSADITMVPTKNTALLYLPSDTPESAASTQDVQAWTAIVVAASTVFAGLLL